MKGYAAPETGEAYARARELWEQLGSPSEFLHIPCGQSLHHALRGEFDAALRLDENLLRLSHQRNDAAGLILAHLSSGRTLLFTGMLLPARSHLKAGLALLDTISPHSLVHQVGDDPQGTSQAYLAIVLLCLGFPDQAAAQSNAAIAGARRLAHLPSLAVSLSLGARVLLLVGDHALGEQADELIAVATEHGFPLYRAAGMNYRGWAKVKNGDVKEGISLLRGGSAAYRATGQEAWMTHYIALLAEACEIGEQVEEAVTHLDEALRLVERTGERWFAAELNRHKGRLLLRQGHPDEAEKLYRRALSIAEAQGAKLWELRAAVSLARLWAEAGRADEARDLLAPVYGWFTEGFDTADLVEAKALIDKLS